MTPRATYRLQFNKDFGFDQAAALAPYLGALGVSHLYASPYLKARPGSTHGYDIVDHAALNPELGDQAAFDRMVAALTANGIKQILDFVPNHMGVGGADNPLWLDVLEWGQDADHAGWFDIDWDPDHRYLHDKLLVPSLGDQYGVALDKGDLRLKFDADEGTFAVWAYDQHKLPICPLCYDRVLGDVDPALERLGDLFSGLPKWRPQVGRRADELKAALRDLAKAPAMMAAIEAAVAKFNGEPGEAASWWALDSLIGEQNWRVAHFRVAGDDINYRRFFNVNDLAGIRMELPDVFDHTHRLILKLLHDGVLDGLRIDHIDGLLDPKAYLERLRAAGGPDFYLVVEKILAHHESLREDWPVQGTTGYEFTNLLLAAIVDPAGEVAFDRLYRDFTGERQAFADIVRNCKLGIMANEMASELNTLARDAARVAKQNPRTADFTRNILHRGIRAIVASFPVYRTYVDTREPPTAADLRDLDWALSHARRIETAIDPSVFDFLARLLSGDLVAQPRSGFSPHTVLRCAMKFQQYSGPVMAKGLEDTAFYRYNRFLALNEVGGHPDSFGAPLAAFHKANAERARKWPAAMLGTSTHDTKRGEDVRARLAVLSEMPEEWERQINLWSRILRARRGDVEGTAPPDRNDEYMFYQLLVGSWPVELLGPDAPDGEALTVYAERIKGALTKSMRESKVHSTWAAPDTAYEDAMLAFADTALDPQSSSTFLGAFRPFAEQVARLGAENTLLQTVLKLTVPGMPDLYQGSELWELSLVDPDNRRPVDFAARAAALGAVREGASVRGLMAQWQDARFKLAATHRLLQLRAAQPALFATGSYDALAVDGADGDEICAFIRAQGDVAMLVVAARFPARRAARGGHLNALLRLPEGQEGRRWTEVLSGTAVSVGGEGIAVGGVLDGVAVAVMVATA
jgi:(1->4)-alpha-D-glucan 1-alpha-D-glucosylmutase